MNRLTGASAAALLTAVLAQPALASAASNSAVTSIPVDPAYQPILMGAALEKESDALLFDFQPERERAHKDEGKAKRDALLSRVRALCKAAGVRVGAQSGSEVSLRQAIRNTMSANNTSPMDLCQS